MNGLLKRVLPGLVSKLAHRPGDPGRATQEAIDRFRADPDNPFLVSFPRTGSHWLRMIMELYFERPLLVRSFFNFSHENYLLLHTHDMNLTERPRNVIYLYRNPVDTVYSLMRYYQQPTRCRHLAVFWAHQYAIHLAHWMFESDFATKKTVITYAELEDDVVAAFQKICLHFEVGDVDVERIMAIRQTLSKDVGREKTEQYDSRVIDISADSDERVWFHNYRADDIWDTMTQASRQLYDDGSKITGLFERR